MKVRNRISAGVSRNLSLFRNRVSEGLNSPRTNLLPVGSDIDIGFSRRRLN
jgi:hypothetical protein